MPEFELIIVNCVECDEEVEVFSDDDEFACPYCNTINVFVDDDSELEEGEELDDEWELTPQGQPLKPGISIIESWCGRHGDQGIKTYQLWTGHRLRCLICWPSWKPKGFEQT